VTTTIDRVTQLNAGNVRDRQPIASGVNENGDRYEIYRMAAGGCMTVWPDGVPKEPHRTRQMEKLTTYTELAAVGDNETMLTPPRVADVLEAFEALTHGHVMKRADGRLARCTGSPECCEVCRVERAIVECVAKATTE
jgi:hypothetical protein